MELDELMASHPPEATAIICGPRRATWRELRSDIAKVTARLAERIEPGQVVAVTGPTSIEFIALCVGALGAGATILPLDPRLPVPEVRAACDRARPALIASADGSPLAGADQIPVVSAAELTVGEGTTPVAVDRDRPGLLLLTSGTTAASRIAMLSRNNMAASIASTIAGTELIRQPGQIVLGVMPLTHVLGLVSVVGVSLTLGATLVLAPDPAVAAVLHTIAAEQVSLLVAPPIFWFRLAEAAESDSIQAASLASVRLGLSGAAPLPGGLAARIGELGVRLRQGYGLTEASPSLTTSVGTDAPATSVGRPLPDIELRLVDEFGDDALIGDVGEVWARGANVFLGYLDDPEATAEVLDADGWLHTGDLGVVDESGHLYLVGRAGDLIITGGFNVRPAEVEACLDIHAAVAASAVVGAPDREYGEVVVAHVVAAPGVAAPTTDELVAHCRRRLAGYKVPTRIEFVDELPRGLNGKLRRRLL